MKDILNARIKLREPFRPFCVAMNCVANGMIFDKTPFQEIYVQPVAHDEPCA